MPRIALVVTTYERPDALALVLDSIARQRVAPDEIIIADDGSGASTAELIAGFTPFPAVPVRAVRQEHRGFRVARLRNLAIAAATADYVVFIDGDMVLHEDFVADHARLARRDCYTQGVRAHADATLTRRLLADPTLRARFFSRGLGGLRRAYLLHSAATARAVRKVANALVAVKACNFGAWRDDLVRVNGFNEAFEGWGPEDKELALRLEHAGIHRQTLLFGGIAIHLHHPPASREALASNLALLEATRRERRVRCTQGLDRRFG